MRMSNYLAVHVQDMPTMAPRSPSLGVDHLTVIPANLPDDERDPGPDRDDPDSSENVG